MPLADLPILKMPYAKYHGYSSVALLTMITAVGSMFILEAIKSSSIVRLTESLDASTQAYFFAKSLANIVQEAFSGHTEWNAYPSNISVTERIENLLNIFKNNSNPGSTIKAVSFVSMTGNIDPCPQPLEMQGNFTYKENMETVSYGFKLGEFLEKGPFYEHGNSLVTFETQYQDKRSNRKTKIETTSFLIPLTNFEIIAYTIGSIPLGESRSSQLKKLTYNNPTSFFNLNQATFGGDIDQSNNLPYYYRYLVTTCRHTFETIWSTQYRNTLLRSAYKEGYFSRESWAVQQFDGLVYNAENDHLSIDLGVWDGSFLGIVDEAGGLTVSITGHQSSAKAIHIWAGSYAPNAPTVIELQSVENQPILGYFSNCAIHVSNYRGALFTDPKTTLHSGSLTISGSIFFDANNPPFENCLSVHVKSSNELKNILKACSPKLILSRSKAVL